MITCPKPPPTTSQRLICSVNKLLPFISYYTMHMKIKDGYVYYYQNSYIND